MKMCPKCRVIRCAQPGNGARIVVALVVAKGAMALARTALDGLCKSRIGLVSESPRIPLVQDLPRYSYGIKSEENQHCAENVSFVGKSTRGSRASGVSRDAEPNAVFSF